MEEDFLKNIRETIKNTPGLTIKGLAAAMDKSQAQTYRILNGNAPYKSYYTPMIREYVGFRSNGNENLTDMVEINIVDLKTVHSLNQEKDVLYSISLPQIMLPREQNASNVKVVKVTSDHCAPEYSPGDYALIDVVRTVPEPPDVFLIWTGIGYKLQFCEHVLGSAPPAVKLSSLNKKAGYDAVETPLSKIDIKGRVIGKISIRRD